MQLCFVKSQCVKQKEVLKRSASPLAPSEHQKQSLMKFNRQELIDDLIRRTKTNKQAAEQYLGLSEEVLNFKESPKSWSVLECLEHLNLYGDFYLPEIEKR